jgi:DNA topoisomerase-1
MQATGLSHKRHLLIQRDYKQVAKIANLVYVDISSPGIARLKKGKAFVYLEGTKTIKNKAKLERIRKLAIPPSWTDVWICPSDNGHIQATGTDLHNRKQYRYHAQWSDLRNETKFHRLYEFGRALPAIRKKIKADLASKELLQEKVLATAINLMEQTYIRIGSNGYEKLYGSYGMTTLKDKHVSIKNEQLVFCFKGKKGVEHTISIKNKRLAGIVKQCRDIPGKELFQYYDSTGIRKCIDSGMVNNYIHAAAGKDFSAKDFRTWAGTLQALKSLRELDPPVSATEIRKNVVAVIDKVSKKLGNTRSVCKKYYIHPGIINLYEENKLNDCLEKCTPPKANPALSSDENLLMQVLKKSL